jgi:hypothetical protein
METTYAKIEFVAGPSGIQYGYLVTITETDYKVTDLDGNLLYENEVTLRLNTTLSYVVIDPNPPIPSWAN